MKYVIAVATLLFSSSLFAQVLAVNTFQPLPGGMPQSLAYAAEAKAIHEAMGAGVSIGVTTEGNMDYAVAFENWEAYGQWLMALNSNERWLAFQAKISGSPSATQIDNRMLTSIAQGTPPGSGALYQVYMWEPGSGAGAVQNLMQGGIGAKPIHENRGANVSVYRDALNKMYYVMTWPDAASWGRFQDTPIPEFQAYMQSLDTTGPGAATLMQVTTGTLQ